MQHFDALFYNIFTIFSLCKSISYKFRAKIFHKSTKKGAKTPLKISQNVAFRQKKRAVCIPYLLENLFRKMWQKKHKKHLI
jgi:hypothetical protein